MEIGTFLLNIGFLFNFIALAFREILWIRLLLTMGYLIRFFTQYLYESNIADIAIIPLEKKHFSIQ